MNEMQTLRDDSIKLTEIYFYFCKKWVVLPESYKYPWADQYYELTQPEDFEIEEKIDEVGGKIIAHFYSEFKRGIPNIRLMPITLMFAKLPWPDWVKKTFITNCIATAFETTMNKKMNNAKTQKRTKQFVIKLLELCSYFPSLN